MRKVGWGAREEGGRGPGHQKRPAGADTEDSEVEDISCDKHKNRVVYDIDIECHCHAHLFMGASYAFVTRSWMFAIWSCTFVYDANVGRSGHAHLFMARMFEDLAMHVCLWVCRI